MDKILKRMSFGPIVASLPILLTGIIHYKLTLSYGVLFILGSLGATTTIVSCYWGTPIARFRTLFLGHLIGSSIGVLCQIYLTPGQPLLSTIVAIFLSIFLMEITKSVHPPAGAVSLIATSNLAAINQMGWILVPVALSGAVIVYLFGYLSYEKLKLKKYTH